MPRTSSDSATTLNQSTRQSARAVRPKILYLVHRVPFPPDKGDRIRNYHILKFISGFADVDLACLADERVDPRASGIFSDLCLRWKVCRLPPLRRRMAVAGSIAMGRTMSEGAFQSIEMARTLADWAMSSRYDRIMVSSSAMVQYLDTPGLNATPAVVDLIDVDSEKWFSYARSSRPPLNWLYALEGRRLRRVERDLKPTVTSIVVVSDDEASLYRRVCKDTSVHAVGNGVDTQYFAGDRPSGSDSPPSCIFVGAMDYPPNIDAAIWFTQNVWVDVRRQFHDARLFIVGREPARLVRNLTAVPGVDVTGTVPDVRPWYSKATVAIAPLRIARGIQNKVLESMAMRLPTIVSPQALCGLGARADDEVLVAESAEEWKCAVSRLFQDDVLRSRIGNGGRAYVENKHSWSSRLLPLRELLTGESGIGETEFSVPQSPP